MECDKRDAIAGVKGGWGQIPNLQRRIFGLAFCSPSVSSCAAFLNTDASNTKEVTCYPRTSRRLEPVIDLSRCPALICVDEFAKAGLSERRDGR